MGDNPFLDNLAGVKFPEPFRRLEINLRRRPSTHTSESIGSPRLALPEKGVEKRPGWLAVTGRITNEDN